MKYSIYILISMFLIVFQTTVAPAFDLFDRIYDLTCLYVLFLGIFRPFSEGLFILFFCGYIMDTLSGGPFGLYLTAYIWIFIIARWVIRYLQVNNIFLMPIVIGISVFIQNMIFVGILSPFEFESSFFNMMANEIAGQILWAVCTGPFLILLLSSIAKKWDMWLEERIDAKRNKQKGTLLG